MATATALPTALCEDDVIAANTRRHSADVQTVAGLAEHIAGLSLTLDASVPGSFLETINRIASYPGLCEAMTDRVFAALDQGDPGDDGLRCIAHEEAGFLLGQAVGRLTSNGAIKGATGPDACPPVLQDQAKEAMTPAALITVVDAKGLREQLDALKTGAEDGCEVVSTMYELVSVVAGRFADDHSHAACSLRHLERAFSAMASSHECGWYSMMRGALGAVERTLSEPLPASEGAVRDDDA